MGRPGGLSRREREVAGLVAEGLTNREIAGRLFIAERTAESHVEQIRNKLGFRSRSQIAAWVAAGTSIPFDRPTARLRRSELPRPISSLVGRESEIQSTAAMVRDRPLVTITGPGGIGKTRLAIEVAWQVEDRFGGGVWLVELSPVRDAESLSSAVFHALHLTHLGTETPEEQVTRFLSSREALVVLDNCEHVISASAQLVERLLSRAPRLRILTTSREPLGISGERVIRVEPLSVSAVGDQRSDALELLAERCRDLGMAELVNDDLGHGDIICRHVDGIPLAIELAAAQAAVLPLSEIASKLDGQFMHLANPARPAISRHQTLHAALDWSYQLLSPRERAAFRRFAVFAGGFDLDAAIAVLDEDLAATVDVVGSLVRKSMLTVRDSVPGRRRYQMLDPLREFATESLHGEGETEVAANLHARHYFGLAERAYPSMRAAGAEVWLRRLDLERDNINAVLQFLTSRDDDRFGLMVAALGRYWIRGRTLNEARWTDRALRMSTLHGRPLFDVMEACSWVSYHRGDSDRSLQIANAMLEEAIRLNDDECIGRAMHWVGGFRIAKELPVELDYWQRAVAHLRRAGADWYLAALLNDVALLSLPSATGLNQILEALDLARKVGDTWLVALLLDAAAWAHAIANEVDEAACLWAEGISTALETADGFVLAYHLDGLAHISRLDHESERACTLLAAAAGIRDATATRADPRQIELMSPDVAAVRKQLGQRFEVCWQTGFQMSPEHAAELALRQVRSV